MPLPLVLFLVVASFATEAIGRIQIHPKRQRGATLCWGDDQPLRESLEIAIPRRRFRKRPLLFTTRAQNRSPSPPDSPQSAETNNAMGQNKGSSSSRKDKIRSSSVPSGSSGIIGYSDSLSVAIPSYIAEILRTAFGENQGGVKATGEQDTDREIVNITEVADDGRSEEVSRAVAAISSKDLISGSSQDIREARVKNERNQIMRGITDAKNGIAAVENALFRQGEEIYELTHALRTREMELEAKDKEIKRIEIEQQREKQQLLDKIDELSRSLESSLSRPATPPHLEDTPAHGPGDNRGERWARGRFEAGTSSEDFAGRRIKASFPSVSSPSTPTTNPSHSSSRLNMYNQLSHMKVYREKASIRVMKISEAWHRRVRGVVPAVILRRLIDEVPDLMDYFDLVTGTSTGGLISMMLASDISPREIERVYYEEADTIFHPSDLRRRANPTKSKYTDIPKTEVYLARLISYVGRVFSRFLGNSTMSDLNKWTLITAFRADGKVMSKKRTFFPSGRWRPSLFTNIPKAHGRVEPDSSLSLLDAAMATRYIDGGLFAANPSLCAISKICANFPHIKPEDVVVLSLGCGGQCNKVEVKDLGDWGCTTTCCVINICHSILPLPLLTSLVFCWCFDDFSIQHTPNAKGVAQWTPHLLSLFFDTSDLATDLYMINLIGERYHRIDPTLDTFVELDDYMRIDELSRLAEKKIMAKAVFLFSFSDVQRPAREHANRRSPGAQNYRCVCGALEEAAAGSGQLSQTPQVDHAPEAREEFEFKSEIDEVTVKSLRAAAPSPEESSLSQAIRKGLEFGEEGRALLAKSIEEATTSKSDDEGTECTNDAVVSPIHF
eukprot:jgi/Bigna1/76761/fgenesh1_pg.43_\